MIADDRSPFVIPVVYAATLWSVEKGGVVDDEETQISEREEEVVVDEEAPERWPLLENIS